MTNAWETHAALFEDGDQVIVTPDNLKVCSDCKLSLPATPEHFYRSKNTKSGFQYRCKTCQNIRTYQWREKNPDGFRETTQRYREGHRDELRERSRNYRVLNPEKVRVSIARYQRENPEKGKVWRRKWYERNQDKWRGYWRTRRSLVANAIHTFTPAHEAIGLDYFNGCCAVCNRPLKDLFGTHTIAWDHWIPLSKGGHTTPDNMVPLCHGVSGCNNSKCNHMPDEWVASQFDKRQTGSILKRIQTYFEHIKSLAVQS